jgi:hypothetical protein
VLKSIVVFKKKLKKVPPLFILSQILDNMCIQFKAYDWMLAVSGPIESSSHHFTHPSKPHAPQTAPRSHSSGPKDNDITLLRLASQPPLAFSISEYDIYRQ